MSLSKDKTAFKGLKFGLLCGFFTGTSTLFLLFLQSIILIRPSDPMELEFYAGYCFRVPLAAAVLGTLVGGSLAFIIDSRKNIALYLIFSIGDWDDCCIDWSKFTLCLEGHLTIDFTSHRRRDRLVLGRLTAY